MTVNIVKQNQPIKLLCLAIAFLLTTGVSAKTYYVSNSGNDDALGTSPLTAWATLGKVNGTTLLPGDSVVFEAGSTWRDELIINHSGTAGNLIVFSRYGTGINPRILGSEKAENWTPAGTANIWQSGTALENLSEEYYPGRIFFMENDSVTWGQYQGYDAGFSGLSQEYDYTVDGNTCYVYAASNPGSRYESVEVTQRSSCITISDNDPQSYLVFDAIDLKFSRMWGFNAGYPAYRGATDLVFRNCTIGYIGAKPSGAAYGISVWHSNLLVENCLITDCGRRGISVNLYLQRDPGEERNLRNIIIRNNEFRRGYHTTALDLSSQQTSTDTIQDVYFYHNYIDDSDFTTICDNCSSNQVFFQDGSGSSFTNNIYVTGNVFVQATARNILFEGVDTSYVWNNTIVGHNPHITENPYANASWNTDEGVAYYRNNILYDNLPDNSMQNHGVFIFETYTGKFAEKDYNLYYSLFPKTDRNFSAHRLNSSGGMGYWNTNEWNGYLLENSLFEQNSPEPGDPLFMHYNLKDFHLTSMSPATGTGTATDVVIVTDLFGSADTLNKYDIEGRAFIPDNWDIGAFSYSAPDSTATNILSFILTGQTGSAIINTEDRTVTVEVSQGTEISSMMPSIELSYGATISPASGAIVDFSTPVIYTVTALNGTDQQEWTVTVTVAQGPVTVSLTRDRNMFSIYPNPAKHRCTIELNLIMDGDFSVKIFSLQGKLVYTSPLFSGTRRVDLSLESFTPGIYTVCLFAGDTSVERKKLIIME
jgi:hypothetical protein